MGIRVVRVDPQSVTGVFETLLELPASQLSHSDAYEHVRNPPVELGGQFELLDRLLRAVLAEQEHPRRHVRRPVLPIHLLVCSLDVVLQDVLPLLGCLSPGDNGVAIKDKPGRR